ncbi:RNA-directed DNA polymerase, eukaryota, partial [Tanacetum coccineum]
MGKGLLMRGHEKVKDVIKFLLNCLISNESIDSSADCQDLMRAAADSLHATIRPLYKQRLFSMVMLILRSSVVKSDSPVTRFMLHRALAHVITNTPLSAIMGEANKSCPMLRYIVSVQRCYKRYQERLITQREVFDKRLVTQVQFCLEDELHYGQHAMLLESETVRKVHKTGDISVLPDVPAGAVVQGLALGGGLERHFPWSNDGTQVDEGPGESVGKCSDLEGESDSEAIPETRFEDEHMDKFDDINYIPHSKPQSEDPFGVYELLNKKKKVTNNEGDSQNSPTYPPGFTPNDNAEDNINISNVEPVERGHNGDKEEGEFVVSQNQDRIDTDIDANESTCSGHFKKSTGPRTGGSIIQLIEDLVNVGQTMGYDMTGCLAQKAKQDWVKKLCLSNKVNFLSLQETKIKNIDLWCIKRCWGNLAFDYVYSEAVGQSGGILSVWDPNKFQKLNHTISDYCTLVRGVWVPNGRKLLIISIYAPQELSKKRNLWDYLCFTICNWNGDVVTTGDFNEVRDSSERFGSVFNKHGAKMFNDFIAKAGLTEVPLGGCIFTWCRKTAS